MRSLNQSDFRLRRSLNCSAHSSHQPFHGPGKPEEILSLSLQYNLDSTAGRKGEKKFQRKYYGAPISSVNKETAMGRNTSKKKKKKDSVPAR